MAEWNAWALEEIEERLKTVEAYIALYAAHSFHDTEVGRVLDAAADARGKLLRPRLLLLAGSFGPDWILARDRLCRLAALVELTHMASLVHDDIVDEAPCRRGSPSLQRKYGKDAAVYAGDFLMSRVSYYIAEEKMNLAGAVLAKTVEEMCAGEIGQALCRYKEDVTLTEYTRNIRGKTAALIMAACRIGAVEGGCDGATVRALEQIGECLGILFQLRDDLLDVTSDPPAMGKAAHRDFADGIYTMPVLCALERPDGRAALLPILRTNRERGLTSEETDRMEKLVTELGGVEATRQEIGKRRERAEWLLLSALPWGESALGLQSMIRELGAVSDGRRGAADGWRRVRI